MEQAASHLFLVIFHKLTNIYKLTIMREIITKSKAINIILQEYSQTPTLSLTNSIIPIHPKAY
jgi:hypothetical protein